MSHPGKRISEGRLPFWSNMHLGPRIAVLIVLSLLAAKLLDQGLFSLIGPPRIFILDRGWLVEEVSQARQAALAVPPQQRAELLDGLEAAKWLAFSVTDDRPALSDDRLPLQFRALKADIAGRSALDPAEVLLQAADDVRGLMRAVRPGLVLLAGLPNAISDITADAPNKEVMITDDFHIALPLDRGSWLTVTQKSDGQELARYLRNVLLPIFSLALIAAVSIVAARGVVSPLSQLAAAAEKLGRSREPTMLDTDGTPEYRAIANSFNVMQSRLKGFVDERLRMLAAISHDLRTPLTRMRLYAEYVTDEEQKRQILSDIADMEAMVSTTLAFASDQLQEEPFSSVDVASLLISLCDTATDAGHAVAYDGPDHLHLCCQPVALRRAFTNLIDNGCKYGEAVTVILSSEPAVARILVVDRGPGIPEDQKARAFEPFQRLEGSRNRETGGTGLGLTIAREVVEKHKGSIRLDPAVPTGLTVAVTLPLPV